MSKYGELSEWSNVSVSKTDEQRCSDGSNPSLSAKRNTGKMNYAHVSKMLRVTDTEIT